MIHMIILKPIRIVLLTIAQSLLEMLCALRLLVFSIITPSQRIGILKAPLYFLAALMLFPLRLIDKLLPFLRIKRLCTQAFVHLPFTWKETLQLVFTRELNAHNVSEPIRQLRTNQAAVPTSNPERIAHSSASSPITTVPNAGHSKPTQPPASDLSITTHSHSPSAAHSENALHFIHINGTASQDNTHSPTTLSALAHAICQHNRSVTRYKAFSGPFGVTGKLFDRSLFQDKAGYEETIQAISNYIRTNACKQVVMLGWSRGATRFLEIARQHPDTQFYLFSLDGTIGGDRNNHSNIKRVAYPKNARSVQFVSNIKLPRFNSIQAAFRFDEDQECLEIPLPSDHKSIAKHAHLPSLEILAGMLIRGITKLQAVAPDMPRLTLPEQLTIQTVSGQSIRVSTNLRTLNSIVERILKRRTQQSLAPHKTTDALHMFQNIAEAYHNRKNHGAPGYAYSPTEAAIHRLRFVTPEMPEKEIAMLMLVHTHHLGDTLESHNDVDAFINTLIVHISSLISVHEDNTPNAHETNALQMLVEQTLSPLLQRNGQALKEALYEDFAHNNFDQSKALLRPIASECTKMGFKSIGYALSNLFSSTQHPNYNPNHPPLLWHKKSS